MLIHWKICFVEVDMFIVNVHDTLKHLKTIKKWNKEFRKSLLQTQTIAYNAYILINNYKYNCKLQ